MRHSSLLINSATVLVLFTTTSPAATVSFIPVRASGVEGIDWHLGPGPREITLVHPGQDVMLEVIVADFAPVALAASQFTVDCESHESGSGSPALAISTLCPVEGSFETDFCLGTDETRSDVLFFGNDGAEHVCQRVVDCPSGLPGEYACGTVILVGMDYFPDGGLDYYATNFAYTFDLQAAGQYVLELREDLNGSFLGYVTPGNVEYVDIESFLNATVTIQSGACCGTGGTLLCTDDTTSTQCEDLNGVWVPDGTCTGVDQSPVDGIDDICPACDSAIDCNEGNACTVGECTNSLCRYVDATPPGQCCNPADGGLTPLDDGNACTYDSCDSAGSVSHVDVTPSDQCCDSQTGDYTEIDDGNACTQDICNLDGSVDHIFSSGCPAPTVVTLQPVSASGVPGTDWSIGPDDGMIELSGGNQVVEFEVLLSGFAPQRPEAFTFIPDCGGFNTAHGTLAFVDNACVVDGETCPSIDTTRADYLFAGIPTAFRSCGTDQCSPFEPFNTFCSAGLPKGESVFDDGSTYYTVRYRLAVSADATGDFTVGLATSSRLFTDGSFVPIDVVVPLTISIPTGACVMAGAACSDLATRATCEDAGGAWLEGLTCDDDLPTVVPTTSTWGLLVLGLLLAVAGKLSRLRFAPS